MIRVYSRFLISSCTSALCAALGSAFAISSRRQLYHSHTRRGSFEKGLRRGQVFGLVLLPKTTVSAEGGDSAFGGDAGSGQHRDAGCLCQPFTSLFQVCQAYILTSAIQELLQLLYLRLGLFRKLLACATSPALSAASAPSR